MEAVLTLFRIYFVNKAVQYLKYGYFHITLDPWQKVQIYLCRLSLLYDLHHRFPIHQRGETVGGDITKARHPYTSHRIKLIKNFFLLKIN